jgi:hypothetical protein
MVTITAVRRHLPTCDLYTNPSPAPMPYVGGPAWDGSVANCDLCPPGDCHCHLCYRFL